MPIELTGAVQTAAGFGAVRVDPLSGISAIELRADAVTIEHAWEQGVELDAGLTRSTYVVDQGEGRRHLDDVDVRLTDGAGQATLLASMAESGVATITSGQGLTVAPDEDVALFGVGTRPDAVVVGEGSKLGFWYLTDGPTLVGRSEGFLRVEGDFSLFVHNVTVEAIGRDRSWSGWTGYREGQTGQAATDYELRVTVLHVENGTLIVPDSSEVRLAVPALSAKVDGRIVFPSASGRLLDNDRTLLFDREPVTLKGAGELAVRADGAADDPILMASPSAGLQPVGFEPSAEGPTGPVAATATVFSLVGVGLLVLATAGMNELGVIPGPTPALQRQRYARWMRRGRWAAVHERWALSAWCYEKAVRAKRDSALAWYDWSYAELEAGHLAAADDVARRAAEIRGVDPLDLLEVRAAVAWERGDAAGFADHITALAKDAPDMARGLVSDMRIDIEALEPRLRKTLEHPRTEVLDGYG